MTGHTTAQRANAVFFSVLMVLSMAAAGFAAAPVAAATVTNASADDVTVGSTGQTQDVTFDVTGTENISIDVSSGNVTSAQVSAGSGTATYFSESDTVEVNPEDGAQNVVKLTHDLSDVNPSIENGILYTITGSSKTTVSFTLQADGDLANRQPLVDSTVAITSGNVVFQGEEDLTFAYRGNQSEVTASSLEGTAGTREGALLQMPIPTDEDTGSYDLNGPADNTGGFSVSVIEPRITTAEVRLDGDDVSSVAVEDADDFTAFAEFNFDMVENITIEVQDESGADITSRVTPSGVTIAEDGTSVPLNLSEEDAGEYTVIFEGDDDLDYGGVIEEYTIVLQNPDSTTIDTRNSVYQGTTLDYILSGAAADRYYFLTITKSEFNLGITRENAANIFVSSDDVVEAGKFTETEYLNISESTGTEDADELLSDDTQYAYALVKSDTAGISGSINTEYLDTSQIEINAYNSTTGDFNGDIGELFYGQSGVDITAQSDQISNASVEILPEEETTEEPRPSITPAQQSLNRSETLDYTVSGVSTGDYHLVAIEKEEFASSLSVSEASNIFTTGGQTVETGVANQSSTDITQVSDIEYAYALIEAGSATPTGQINTEYIGGPTVDLKLFPAGEGRTGDRLTTPLDTSTIGLPSSEPGYNLTIKNDGSVHSIGFPGPIEGDLNDLFVSGTDGIDAVYRFDSTSQSWEQQTDFGYAPDELTAIAIVTSGTGPSNIDLQMKFQQQTIAVPGTRAFETEGWHFVSPSSFDTPRTVFERGTTRNSLVLDSFAGPQLEIAQTPATFQAQHGSRVYDMGSDSPPVMNPFEGYFVYVTGRGDQPSLIANTDTRYELDDTLNTTYE